MSTRQLLRRVLTVTLACPAVMLALAGPASADQNGNGGVNLNVTGNTSGASSALSTVLLLGLISLVPALLLAMTAFTRISVVMGLTRTALGTSGVPPTQVLVGLSLFLTMFVMGPTLTLVNNNAIQPYLNHKISVTQAYDRGIEPMREFMLKQVDEKDLSLMVKLSQEKRPATPKDLSTTALIPAFILSELRKAFMIGFVIFVPFLIIDLVVAAVLTGVGMVMVPPAVVSLPFKLLLFVVADGWFLLTQSVVGSFQR